MTVTVNGAETPVPEGSSLYDLILIKKWRHVRMHIRIDGKDIPAEDYSGTLLKEGQYVEILPRFGGG